MPGSDRFHGSGDARMTGSESRGAWRSPAIRSRASLCRIIEEAMPSAQSGVANGIGQPVRRKEDFRLLTGRGRYGDDVSLPRMTHAVFVRSPHAHARIVSISKRAALTAPGVLAVLTGSDYLAAGLWPIPHHPGLSAPPDVQAR